MRRSKYKPEHSRMNHQRSYGRMNLEQQLEGMVTLGLPIADPSRILALLSESGIVLYHVEAEGETLYITIELDDFKRTQRLLRNCHIRFRICGKRGVPFFISRCKSRTGIWAALLCTVVLMHWMLSFLWTYEVTGNERYSEAHIIALVQQYGLWPGTRLSAIDYEALEHTIELEHPEFTWVQLERKGTALCIAVKERLADTVDLQDTGSIVAKASGRITKLTVFTGIALADIGDVVQAGQVLIGGWDYPERVRDSTGVFVDTGEPYAVYAKGEVRGEVTHRAIGTCALEETWLVKTGRTAKNTAILWGTHQLFAFGEKVSPYQYSEISTQRKSLLQWGKWQCPIILCTTIYQEQAAVQRSFVPEEAYRTAVEYARRQLEQSMPQNGVFVRESSGVYRSMQEGVVQAEVVWVVEEPLGQRAQVSLP